jgi:uroporphyrin-3 C-methyltransferase
MGGMQQESSVSEDPRPEPAGGDSAKKAASEPESSRLHAPEREPPRRSGGPAWLALLLALALAGWQAWDWWLARDQGQRDAQVDSGIGLLTEQVEILERRLESLESEQQRLTGDAGSLRNRLADIERLQRSLREEVLGVGERAGLLEDAVARLAERRLEGQAALRLDEAESLLRLAHQRQRLAGDRETALAALRLADHALAGIESAQLVTLRQTLRREIADLESARDIDIPALARRLDDLRGMLARLPEARPEDAGRGEDDTPATLAERLGAALARVVTVRRIGPEAALEDFPVEVRRAGLALEIELMRAALAARDDEAWQRGSQRLERLLAEGFDESAPLLASARGLVADLAAARLAPAIEAPELALRELRNLRAMRSIARDPPSVPEAGEDDSGPGNGRQPEAADGDEAGRPESGA